jgi:microcystin degradation protein MlrC
MSQEPRIPSDALRKSVQDQVKPRTPALIVDAIAVQIHTAHEARERIDEEGSVVRDLRGAVVPHPAIKIEADAIKIYTALLDKHKR